MLNLKNKKKTKKTPPKPPNFNSLKLCLNVVPGLKLHIKHWTEG